MLHASVAEYESSLEDGPFFSANLDSHVTPICGEIIFNHAGERLCGFDFGCLFVSQVLPDVVRIEITSVPNVEKIAGHSNMPERK